MLARSLRKSVDLATEFADYQLRYGRTDVGPPSIVPTVKVNQAGFHDTMDNDVTFRAFQRKRSLPFPDHLIA